jgi:hypothetical protein
MKKYLLFALCLAVGILSASMVFAFTGSFTPGTGINGTVHDLHTGAYSANPADPIGGRICIFCHAPHNTIKLSVANGGSALGSNLNAPDAYSYLPLWNHQLTTQTYLMYYNGPGEPQSGSHQSQAEALLQASGATGPGGVSLLCLSCHDGSVAVNSYGTGPLGGQTTVQPSGSYSTGSTMINSAYVIGQDGILQNHHPVGFSYDTVQSADTEIRSSTTVMSDYSGNSMSIADHLYAGSAISLSGCTGSCMECETCHSVHNKNNTGERLLWRSDVNSQLCLTCHDKGTYTAPETVPAGALP